MRVCIAFRRKKGNCVIVMQKQNANTVRKTYTTMHMCHTCKIILYVLSQMHCYALLTGCHVVLAAGSGSWCYAEYAVNAMICQPKIKTDDSAHKLKQISKCDRTYPEFAQGLAWNEAKGTWKPPTQPPTGCNINNPT